MNIRQIRTFFYVAKLGSFAKAAQELNATHSAVSMRIKELELDLNMQLFDRSKRQIKITSDGLTLLPLAEQLLGISDEIGRLKLEDAPIRGRVRLGVVETIALTWLANLIDKLHAWYPEISVEVEVGLSFILEERLVAGDLDAILAPCEMSRSDFVHLPIGSIQFRWMCLPSLGVPKTLSVGELGKHPLIVTSRAEKFRGSLLQWAINNKLKMEQPYICNTFVISYTLVRSGLGVAFLPLPIYAPEVDKGELMLIDCNPEVPPLEHYFIRPIMQDRPIMKALEDATLASSTFVRLAGN